MNRKAFTLVEILGVIVIISILLILVASSIISRVSNSDDDSSKTENELIYNAADQYIEEHPSQYPPGKSGRYCITIQSLIDDGKLVAPVKDVNTGKDITNLSIMVTVYSNGTTDHELKEGDECKEIAALPMIDFQVDPRGSSWVKQRKVTIIYPKMEGNYEASHRIDKGQWTRDNSADQGGQITLTFTKSAQLEARLKGNNTITSKINIVNVDSEIPVIDNIKVPEDWTNTPTKTVTIKVTDNISGINGYYLSDTNVKPSETDAKWVSKSYKSGTQTINLSLKKGTYYIFFKDKAGNISEASNNKIVVDKIDLIKPTCELEIKSGTLGNNDWYVSDVVVGFKVKQDNESYIASYGISTSTTPTYNNNDTATQNTDGSSITYYGYVKDAAGNISSCTLPTFKRDATKPVLNYTLQKADGGGYNSGNLSDQDVIRRLFPSDNLSGIDHTEYNNGSGWFTEGYVDSYTFTASNNSNYRTIDKAGNISDEINLNIIIQKDPDINMSAGCRRICGPNGRNCYVNGKNFGASWEWTFDGAGSGINPYTMWIDYSTEWVQSYCQLYYPTGRAKCGSAEWGSNWIKFARSYARSHITGTACSNRGTCRACTVWE